MKILLCGASGFVGRHLTRALRQAGHRVVPTTSDRARAEQGALLVDFGRDTKAATWLARLEGVDVVINAVGVLRDSPKRPMAAIHTAAPMALFEACAQAGVRRVIHVSALGIDHATVPYAITKLAAEHHLQALNANGRLDATVLRPSIIFGPEGDSSRLFVALARLPVLALPRIMLRARIQPVAVGDLAEAVVRVLEPARGHLGLLACVGPQALSVAAFIASLRAQMGKTPAKVLALPEPLTRWGARVGDRVPTQPFCSDALALLAQDNVADARPLTDLLGRPPVGHQDLWRLAWH